MTSPHPGDDVARLPAAAAADIGGNAATPRRAACCIQRCQLTDE